MSKKNRKPDSPPGDAGSPADHPPSRSLGDIYREKRQPSGGSQRSSAKPWIIAAVVVAACIAGYAAFRPGKSPEKKPAAVAATPPAKPPPSQPNQPPHPAQPPPPTGLQPRIQFASTSYDFGRPQGGSQVDCFFSYTNTGVAPLELTEVMPGCGCIKLLDYTKNLAPGQAGSIKVRFDSTAYTGPFAKSIHVKCNDAANPSPMLEIKGYVFRPIEISPQFASITLTPENPSNAALVRIINHTEQPLTLSPPVVSAPGLAAELRTNVPGKEFQLVVSTPPPFPTNPVRGAVTMQTSSTNTPVVSVNASVNVQPLVNAFPNRILLPASPLTNVVPFNVFFRNNSTNALKLSEPSVNAPGVTVSLREDAPGSQFTAALSFPAGFEAKPGEQIDLTVKCNHALMPLVKVPVLQPQRPAANPAQPVANPAQPAP